MITHGYSLEKDSSWFRQRPHIEEAFAIRDSLAEKWRAVVKAPMLKRVCRLAFAYSVDSRACRPELMAFQMLYAFGYGDLSIGVLEKNFISRGVEIPDDIE